MNILEWIIGSPRCLLCGTPHCKKKMPLCQNCYERLGKQRSVQWIHCCQKCGIELISEEGLCTKCRHKNHYYHSHYSLFNYENHMKFLLKQYKFHNVCSLDYLFASFLNDFLTTRYPGFPLIPVPSGKKRIYRESRLSKMEKITNILKRKYGMEVYPVLTMKKGIKQKRLSAEEREKNILGRVKAVKKIHKITGQSVLLLDDVYTTGSTMSECGRILLLNGVREVHGITLFRD